MALLFSTQQPERLLNAFREGVCSGDIPDWRCNARGEFTQIAPRWSCRAWLHPTLVSGGLCFYTVTTDHPITRETYAHYQAKLTETFINHFFEHYEEVSITANATRAEAV